MNNVFGKVVRTQSMLQTGFDNISNQIDSIKTLIEGKFSEIAEQLDEIESTILSEIQDLSSLLHVSLDHLKKVDIWQSTRTQYSAETSEIIRGFEQLLRFNESDFEAKMSEYYENRYGFETALHHLFEGEV